MPQLSESLLSAIKNAVDIASLIGEHFPLHRHGSKFKALCPFHDDHNPSMEINPDRQSFKCWVCGAGGDIFDFVKLYERVEFPEAARMLADRAGVAIDAGVREGGAGPSKTDLLEVMEWTSLEFQDALKNGPEAEEARNYLAKRGLSQESVVRFRLGYAPESRDWLTNRARKRGFAAKRLEAAGLLGRRADSPGILRERFCGRLMFPIHDARGRTIAFGGRVLPELEKRLKAAGQSLAKYVNSPETLLFQKRRTLYAADLARDDARKEGWVAVTEGYTDVIAAHQAGLRNFVGTLGTALGDEHALALRRLANQTILIFDGDAAGQTAADRSLEIFLGHDLDVRILTLPDNLDPCDFLIERGGEPFRQLLASAVDPLSHAIDRAFVKFQLDAASVGSGIALERSRQAAEWVISVLSKVPRNAKAGANFKVEKSLDVLARRLRMPVADLHQWLGKARRQTEAQVRKAKDRRREQNAGPRDPGSPPSSSRGTDSRGRSPRFSTPSSASAPASRSRPRPHPATAGREDAVRPHDSSTFGEPSDPPSTRSWGSPQTADEGGPPPSETPSFRPARETLAELDPIDRELARIALDNPEAVGNYLITRVPIASLRNAPLRAILQTCYDLHGEGHLPSFDLVSLRLDDPARALAAALLLPFDSWPSNEGLAPPPWEERLQGVLSRWADRERKDQIRELQAILAGMDPQADPEEYDAMRREIYRLSLQRPDGRLPTPSG